jgi:hypothetical protein
MKEVRSEFETNKTVEQCAVTFRDSVQRSYGVGRKLIAGLGSLRGSTSGGVEFFDSQDSPFSVIGPSPTWKAGALIPGHSKWSGATKMAVHIYVLDKGDTRLVQLVGPYGTGDKGSTERLVSSIQASF